MVRPLKAKKRFFPPKNVTLFEFNYRSGLFANIEDLKESIRNCPNILQQLAPKMATNFSAPS